MERTKLIKFKRIINQKITEIKNRLIEKCKVDVNLDSDGDEVDTIQAKILAEMGSKLSNRDVNKLKLLEKSLDKINDGSYGECEECGEDIAEPRLEFEPTFSTCVLCAEILEKKGR